LLILLNFIDLVQELLFTFYVKQIFFYTKQLLKWIKFRCINYKRSFFLI